MNFRTSLIKGIDYGIRAEAILEFCYDITSLVLKA